MSPSRKQLLARAEKAEAQLYEACKQLAGEYVLGEPLTEAKRGERYICINKHTGRMDQGVFVINGQWLQNDWTYYADPRPWPQKPEATTDYDAVNKITGKMYQGTPRPVLPEPTNQESKMNAYKLPIGTEIVIGKRRWQLNDRQKCHPDRMFFRETTFDEGDPLERCMYPSEVQWLIDNGAKVTLPEKKPRYTLRDCGDCGEWFRITRDEKDFCAVEYRADAELLVKLLNESEAKDE